MSTRTLSNRWNDLTQVQLAALVLLGSAAILAIALGFEHIGGYAPCALCLRERVPYYAGIGGGAVALAMLLAGRAGLARIILGLIAIGYVINVGMGIYHSGVEWHWWPGPAECSTDSGTTTDASGLSDALAKTRLVRCDEAPWRFLGLSFAGWSVVASLALAALAARATFRAREHHGA